MAVVCSCGSKMFWESRACSGTWRALVDSQGEIEDTDLDGVITSRTPKTVICAECGKRNPNPRRETKEEKN